MVRLFDYFAFLCFLLVITGGFVLRIPHLYLDLSSVDTFAMIALVLFAFFHRRIAEKSKVYFFWNQDAFREDTRPLSSFFWGVFGILFLAHVGKHWSLLTDGFDLTFLHQALFHPFSHPFFSTDMSHSGSMMGEHLVFSLVPLSIFTQFLRSDELIFLIQALAVAVPLYFLLFKSALSSRIRAVLLVPVILVLANASLRQSLIFDFREDSFAFLGLMISILGSLNGKIAQYLLGFFIAILAKEHVFLITLAFSPILVLSREIGFSKKTKWALALFTALASVIYGALAFRILIPYFNPTLQTSGTTIVLRLHQFGDTPNAILENILLHPINWFRLLGNFLSKDALLYLAKMLVPLLPFLFFREAFLFSVPGLVGMAINVFSGHHGQTSMQFHYDLVVFPFLFTGLCVGVWHQYTEGFLRPSDPKRSQKALACILLAFCFSGKWPLFQLTHFFPTGAEIQARLELLKLDHAIPVVTSVRLSAQVTQHNELLIFDPKCDLANRQLSIPTHGYLLVDPKDSSYEKCIPPPIDPPLFRNEEVAIYEFK